MLRSSCVDIIYLSEHIYVICIIWYINMLNLLILHITYALPSTDNNHESILLDDIVSNWPELNHSTNWPWSGWPPILQSQQTWLWQPWIIYLIGGINPLENISQLGLLFTIYVKTKNVPNHQPVYIRICTSEARNNFILIIITIIVGINHIHKHTLLSSPSPLRNWRKQREKRPPRCGFFLRTGKPSFLIRKSW